MVGSLEAMKKEFWVKVKVGSWVIYSDEYDGVHRAKVVETDIRIYEPGTPSLWGYPYGLTKDTGVVRIQYNEVEKIENLANLIRYSALRLDELQKAWDEWQQEKSEAEGYRETFLVKAAELRGL